MSPTRRSPLPLFGLLTCALVAPSLFAVDAPPRDPEISAAERQHWAFLPVKRPAVPHVAAEATWQRTPLDAFILEKLQTRKLAPQPHAAPDVLLRRLSFDLRGLPPSPAEREAFAADTRPGAYERQVDRWLAAPEYGEQTALLWLDLARFAETDGFEHDKVRPTAWQYRDWVIRAFNRDMPYDRFLSWQLAGDELAPSDPEARIATMFCLSGPDMPDINAQDLRRHNLLNEMTGTVGSVFLALQLGCAQCHDHKYDPLSQGDFFRLRAFFDPAVTTKRDQLISTLGETKREPPASYFYLRGEVTRPAGKVEPAFPRVLQPGGDAGPTANPTESSSGRRTALARWLVRPEHPLTARVMANRVWQRHFGRGLVNSPSDFGALGDAPSHPELLDYLASELMTHDWNLKPLTRLIVTSAVYRQQSAAASGAAAADEDLYASYPRRRLGAEAIRDAMLAVSGQLNSEAGGPGVMPPLAPEVKSTLLGDQWKVSADPAAHVRRSVYIFARRNLRYPHLEAFDRADANQSCAARHVSTTAPQALLMLNSDFSLVAAQHLAGRVLAAGDRPAEAIERVYATALARSPSERERRLALGFLTAQAAALQSAGRTEKTLALPLPPASRPAGLSPAAAAALVDFCLAILNTSEFVYLD